MKWSWVILAALLITGPAISYFKYERSIQPANASGQLYAVVDETLWRHARPDLEDVRLFAAQKEIPYALTIEAGGSATEQKPLRLLQPGTVGGKTQFLLDMAGTQEYDRVQLKLTTKNFVAHVIVQGQDDPHGRQWVTLGTTTLYDLTEEKLGHNSTLQIPLSTYKYLRGTVDGVVKPSELESAIAGATRAEKAIWRDVTVSSAREQKERQTVLTFEVPTNVPVERVEFTIDPSQPNFRRSVEIRDSKEQVLGLGEISRVHMQRNGQKIDVEEASLPIRLPGPGGTYRVLIHNGDDVSLRITDAHLQQYERRIYFDADEGGPMQLYYGDEKLNAPIYDYRKFLQKDANAGRLSLGAELMNAAYTGRPDDRPWSERHTAVLWAAIIAAVLLLGGLAFRSLKSATT